VPGKWLLNTRLKKKTWTNPKIKHNKMGYELLLIGPQTRHKNPEHIYLNS
jgi:hypothetical protein